MKLSIMELYKSAMHKCHAQMSTYIFLSIYFSKNYILVSLRPSKTHKITKNVKSRNLKTNYNRIKECKRVNKTLIQINVKIFPGYN